MVSIVMFFIFVALFAFLLIRAGADEVKQARAARACFGTLAAISTALALITIIGGAPASIILLAVGVTALTGTFAALAVKAVKEAEAFAAKANAMNEVLDTASKALRERLEARAIASEHIIEAPETEMMNIFAPLGTFRRGSQEFLVGYTGYPVVYPDGEEIFPREQLRVARF